MLTLLQAFCCLAILTSTTFSMGEAATSSFDWGYSGTKAPSYWKNTYKECGSTHQSPINIDSSTVIYDSSLKPFVLTYQTSTAGDYTLSNWGQNFEVSFGSTVWNASFDGTSDYCYSPTQIHFHWGSTNSIGSEHTLNNKQYPLELHMVMYNCKLYSNSTVAASSTGGLAVIGVFFELDDTATENTALANILSKMSLSSMRQCSCTTSNDVATTTMSFFDLNDLLPSDRSQFYRYSGSLTTPPCTENVLWTVMKNTLKVSSAQMNKFRNLLFAAESGVSSAMVDNYRPVLSLNPSVPTNAKRYISASFQGAGNSSPTLWVIAALAVASVLTLFKP